MPLKRLLGPLVATLVTLAVVVGYWWTRSPETTKVKVGDLAPELELPSLGGAGKSRLSSFRSRPVLLVMFYSGCHTCQRDTPGLERLHREFVKQGLRVIGVAVDPDKQALEKFVAEQQITFIVLQDANGAAVRAAYGTFKFPEAYLLDAQGRVVAVYLGSVDWRGPGVLDQVKMLLPHVVP